MYWELIKLRKEHKLSQEDMAEILGINPRTYSLKENGKSDFKYKELFIIAKLFNKTIDEIFLPNDTSNTDNLIEK